jgi:cytochrome P450
VSTPARTFHASAPPEAEGWPWVGSALAFRRDPVKLLGELRRRLGPVFTLNLAGLRITLVSDLQLLAEVLESPEDVLSSGEAQRDFGFEIMLGRESLFLGTDVHHRLLTRHRGRWASDVGARLRTAVSSAAARELAVAGARFEPFELFRRMALRATVEILVDPQLLADAPEHVDAYMRFQDDLEDATARALVMPRWLGEPLLLAPVSRQRAQIVAQLAPLLAGSTTLAPYAMALRQELGGASGDVDAATLAEVVVGLLFAAHKNPALAAAQTVLMLLEHPAWLERVCAELASTCVSASGTRPLLDRCIRETLRLTAHTIGAIRRVVGRPFVLGSRYKLPPGAYVGSAHILVSLDDAHFSSPERFDPDRYQTLPRAWPSPWIPFSAGVHGCPGQRLALDLIGEMVAAVLVRRPRLRAAGPIPALSFVRATLAQRTQPCWLS